MFQKTQRGLQLFPLLQPMRISQVQAVTMRRAVSRSLDSASLAEAPHTQNVNTDRGHLHQGVERKRRRREKETVTDIKRATEIKRRQETKIEIEKEIETDTGEEKGMIDMEIGEVTGIEGKIETEIEAETMIEAEEGVIQRGKRGMGKGRGAQKKGSMIRMAKERRGGIQMKTEGRTNIRKKRRSKGKNLRGKRQRGEKKKILKRWNQLVNVLWKKKTNRK